jgi:hypothetical protein
MSIVRARSSKLLNHGNEQLICPKQRWPGVAVLGTQYQQQTGYTKLHTLLDKVENLVEL